MFLNTVLHSQTPADIVQAGDRLFAIVEAVVKPAALLTGSGARLISHLALLALALSSALLALLLRPART